jgi:cobalt/nickel transport system ATP-binding protein
MGMEDSVRLSVKINSFKYPDGTMALADTSLEIRRGEFAGILGSNGSGKTTLLKVMDGLLKNLEGRILLDGVDIKKLSPRDIYQKVGLVFQNPDDQLFATTVFEDVASVIVRNRIGHLSVSVLNGDGRVCRNPFTI